jgi:hypothetical protein
MICRAVLPNAGLGNKLFPWARCRLFSLEHDVPMLAPMWMQLKLGPLVRRDRDKRLYHNLFRTSPPGYISGAAAVWRRLIDRHAVVFSGAADHFAPLNGKHALLLEELRQITRERWLHRADEVGPVDIGVHVRRGDFVEAQRAEDYVLRGAIRTPLDWYVQAILAARAITGEARPAVVVSDARDAELEDLLRIEAVGRVDTGSAIGDLLVLSQARLLIASGGSSFSAWAAFLGQMPAIAYPGQSLSWFQIEPTGGQYIGAWDPSVSMRAVLGEPALA